MSVTTSHWKQFIICFLDFFWLLNYFSNNLQIPNVTIEVVPENFIKTWQKVPQNVLSILSLLPVVLGTSLHSLSIFFWRYGLCLTRAKYLSLSRKLNMGLFMKGLSITLHHPRSSPLLHTFSDIWIGTLFDNVYIRQKCVDKKEWANSNSSYWTSK